MYGDPEPLTLFYIEALLYVQEAQFDKFRQGLVVSNVFVNVPHTNEQISGVR